MNKVVLMFGLIFLASFAQAEVEMDKKQFMADMMDANPVPNYVLMIKNNAEKLGMFADQMKAVKAWNSKHSSKMSEWVKAVIEGEQKLKMASLNGRSMDEILEMSQSVHESRQAIIQGKTECRDHIRGILDENQWNKLVVLIKKA